MNPQDQHGLFLVTDPSLRVLNTQALANDIVARIERDFARANRSSAACLPINYFEPHPDTPIVVLRRVVKSLYSIAFSA